MNGEGRGFCPVLKRGFLFYALSAVLLAVQFGCYMVYSPVLGMMDMEGWAFFVTSCVSHASQLALVPFVAGLLLCAVGLRRVGADVHVALVAVLSVLAYVNMQVYSLYRFHINGFVLNMFFGESRDDIFTFDVMLYVKEGAMLAALAVLVGGLWWLSGYVWRRFQRSFGWLFCSLFVCCTLFAHGCHVYGSFMGHQSVVKSARLIPYYFPLTAYGFMVRHGFEAPVSREGLWKSGGSTDVNYPLHEFETSRPDTLPNIVLILIDSWNRRAFTPECMPCTYEFARRSEWYANHVSGSNGTRSGVFSLFYGLPCYYWEAFESSGITPPLVARLLELGYDFRVYPSASLVDPPFAKVLFRDVPNLRVRTEGETVLERDTKLAELFMGDVRGQAETGRPFFSFLFFDLPHSFQLPPERNRTFQPAWDFADYTRLNNDADPTPLWNLYRNCCHEDDALIGRVLGCLEENGLMENTIVIITGDHSQEFNENHKNYWGHNGNFSLHQIGVPLVCHFPGRAGGVRFGHRTTHYDVAPTLMSEYLGVRNQLSDYSAGHLLTDTVSRDWHFVGSSLNFAFIIDGDSILEKEADGALDVYDSGLNAVSGYRIPIGRFNEAMTELNRWLK